ncbi:Six-bladed beta-propeller TolB-like protein [Lasiodiplodia theobromae]|uniref:Six-bladed beta-propeller TolB-like protein n=1 Tax=Lasiodiplodia theobromae TaxID=45133 RepID=UPI0015C2E1E4|nr:Six-bladed beta-propeller TolB-like protein [Lasiodiplodia theobromae]KAF4545171.1 Six-bladed beta-propeller TolB-like protein [Lasiodiplodia theobromae]
MRLAASTTATLLYVAALAAPTLQMPLTNEEAIPPPPDPEPISVSELPLPPVTPSTDEGSCTPDINPRRTGCIAQTNGLIQSGSFLPDGNHVTAAVTFAGAPAAPDSASMYNGSQIVLVKTDGSAFPNGDAWKCITCGVPEENAVGRSETVDYPQTFSDGKRLLAGTNIIDCGDSYLNSTDCTPEKVHIYPIRWNVKSDGSGASGTLRELRIHPDDVHLGFNSFGQTAGGKLDQQTYFARLEFNPSPTTGTPLAPRYDLTDVNLLFNPNDTQPVSTSGSKLYINPTALTVGELRGFSGSGKEVTYIGYPAESCNIDVFAADLTTGAIRRLTSHPEYTDPVDISPDDAWTVAMDTRGSGRQMFMAGMRFVPPVVDMIATTAASSTRNNGARRFFQPYLIDRYGDRGDYFGQRVNAAGNGSGGAVNDPDWNGMADPRWSPDGTRIAFWQALAVPPACGGKNPNPCHDSTEPGGRTARLMLASLTSREPKPREKVAPVSDVVPWGTPYVPGEQPPSRFYPGEGTYTLEGKSSGSAEVVIAENSEGTAISNIVVTYKDFSDDGATFLNGAENVTVQNPSPTLEVVDWFSDLVQTGATNATKKTSPDGFHLSIDVMTNIFNANGTLTTTIDGQVWKQPANET